jgi:hypothetical protein
MWRVIGGSLSIIMSSKIQAQRRNRQHRIPIVDTRAWTETAPGDAHSSSFSTLFSIESACLPNTARQTCAWIDRRAGKNRISRLGAREADSLRQVRSSSTRWPMR